MKRILVVEDEDAIREFVVINLQRAGYDVVEACLLYTSIVQAARQIGVSFGDC